MILRHPPRLRSYFQMVVVRAVAVCKDLDLVWVWFYKDVAPTVLFKGANPAK